MIDPKSITIHCRDIPEDLEEGSQPERQWVAALSLNTEHRMSAQQVNDLSVDELNKVEAVLKKTLRSAIWDHIYGDLEPLFMELIAYAKRNQPHGVPDIELNMLINNIIKKMTPGIDKSKE